MRRLALLALATTMGGLAVAGERAGKVIRVDHPPRREAFVPAGAFWMGVTEDDISVVSSQCSEFFEPGELFALTTRQSFVCNEYSEELDRMHQRQVFLAAFAIDRHEVTVADYRKCITAGLCNLDPLIAGDERYIRDEWPIVNVTWAEAQEFCRWRGGRLPTEAEWERAARGADVTNEPESADQDRAAVLAWPWCQEMKDPTKCVERAEDFNHGQPRAQSMREISRRADPLQLLGDPDAIDGYALIAPPGTYAWSEGPYHTRDQAGNVAEWTADARVQTLGYEELPGCTKRDERIVCINPRRDGSDRDPRVVRGGSWRQPSFVARSNVRDPFGMIYDPRRRFSHVGFRCARSLSNQPERAPVQAAPATEPRGREPARR